MSEVVSIWQRAEGGSTTATTLTGIAISTGVEIDEINRVYNQTASWSSRAGALLTSGFFAKVLEKDMRLNMTPIVTVSYIYNGKTTVPILRIRMIPRLTVE